MLQRSEIALMDRLGQGVPDHVVDAIRVELERCYVAGYQQGQLSAQRAMKRLQQTEQRLADITRQHQDLLRQHMRGR